MGNVEILDTLRHTCHACGGSCSGMAVRVLDEAEGERVRGFGEALGIADSVQGDRLREADGACVFLGEDQRCRIHARWGGEVKPRVCQQYPVIAIRVEEGMRLGLDPGCLTQWRSWRDGPEVDVENAILSSVPLDPRLRGSEEGIIALCGAPDVTVARLIGTLTGETPDGEGLPAGFADRWCMLMLKAPLAATLARYGQAQVFHRHLAELLAELDRTLKPGEPPAWPVLSPEADAYAVELARRMVFLRMGAKRGPPPAVALVALGGALTCAWGLVKDGAIDEDGWAQALSVWTRFIRSDVVWRALFPEPGVMRWLVTGQGG